MTSDEEASALLVTRHSSLVSRLITHHSITTVSLQSGAAFLPLKLHRSWPKLAVHLRWTKAVLCALPLQLLAYLL